MASNVYFWNLRTSMKMPYDKRIKKLIKRAGIFATIASKDLVAVKLHFGEAGTTAFISPLQVAPVVALIKKNRRQAVSGRHQHPLPGPAFRRGSPMPWWRPGTASIPTLSGPRW